MIDINKKYRTRDGREVRIYATDGLGLYPIHAALKIENVWESTTYTIDGKHILNENNKYDLIEIDEKAELLEEAKRRYPIGTRFIYRDVIQTVNSEPYSIHESDSIHVVSDENEWSINGGEGCSNPRIYDNGKWSEIVKQPEKIKYSCPNGLEEVITRLNYCGTRLPPKVYEETEQQPDRIEQLWNELRTEIEKLIANK